MKSLRKGSIREDYTKAFEQLTEFLRTARFHDESTT